MEMILDINYSNILNKIKRKKDIETFISKKLSLKDLVDTQIIFSKKEIYGAYIESLKYILEEEEIDQIIHRVFEIEILLDIVCDKYDYASDLPDFQKFYASVSPLFLRIIQDNFKTDLSHTIKDLKEALRVAIEEEVFIWQEKIVFLEQKN